MVYHQRPKSDSLLDSHNDAVVRQYDSISSSSNSTEATRLIMDNDNEETSPLFLAPGDRTDRDCGDYLFFGRDDHEATTRLPSRRRHQRLVGGTVAVLFGIALLAGIVTMWTSQEAGRNDGWMTTYSSDYDSGRNNNDDDDYDYDYKYSSWSDMLLKVPLLGSSHKHRAQRHADEAKAYLYMDPSKHHHHHKHYLWGSSGKQSGEETNDGIGAPEGCEGTVLIVRHCEKGSIREHCNYVGYERSVYLASLFGNSHGERYPEPSYLIAESPGDRRNPNKRNFRELETLLPLADKFHITVDTSFSTLDMHSFQQHVHELFRSGDMCGKLMVISWKHSKIPRVATALGCGPEEGCPMEYDQSVYDETWQIKFAYRTQSHSESKNLKESKHPTWLVYGSVQHQGFDPLAFSKLVGDYPKGGTTHGARWKAFDHEIPERTQDDSKTKKHHKKQ